MENEKSSVDILRDIAKRNHWDVSVYERIISERYGIKERNVLVKGLDVNNSYFISTQSANTTKYELYSGIFSPILVNFDYQLLIRERDAIDKVNFRKNKLRFKIGNSLFDSEVFVETNNDIETHKLLSNSGVQKDILNFFKIM